MKFQTKNDLLISLRDESRDFVDLFVEVVLNDSLNKVKVDPDQCVDDVIKDLSSVSFAVLKSAYDLAQDSTDQVESDEYDDEEEDGEEEGEDDDY